MRQVLDFSSELLFCDGYLTQRQKEMLATLVSGQNRSSFCMHAHAFALHRHGCDDELVGALGRGIIDDAPVTAAEKELFRFATKMTHQSDQITAHDVQSLRDSGWSENQIAETVYVTAAYAFFNRVANAFGLENPKYFEAQGATNPLNGVLP
jgi:uncharacterized peroxidase-related enzyme